jgi:hypothetical protein
MNRRSESFFIAWFPDPPAEEYDELEERKKFYFLHLPGSADVKFPKINIKKKLFFKQYRRFVHGDNSVSGQFCFNNNKVSCWCHIVFLYHGISVAVVVL